MRIDFWAANPFLFQMSVAVRDEMKEAYPELSRTRRTEFLMSVNEEARFAHTLDVGLKRLEDDIENTIIADHGDRMGKH